MNVARARLLSQPGIVHGFFGREGGVSRGIYAALNCGPGSRDDPEAVRENRRLVAAGLGAAKLVSLAQIHSPTVYQVDAQWDAQARREGDGLVTATPGIALAILTADCAPVLLADAKARVIGAAHAGWKGALGGVLEATLAAMERLGASRGRIAAAIGPCIAQADYEVGAEFRDRFLEAGTARLQAGHVEPANARFFAAGERPGHYRFDLQAYVASRLEAADIAPIETLAISTYPAENGYFSFRRATHRGEPDYGRDISAVMLTP
jgi:YfiH family protein